MGHAISILDFESGVSRKYAWECVNDFCRANCDPWEYDGCVDDVIAAEITWRDDTEFPDFAAAEEFLYDYRCNHTYEPVAVRYRSEGKESRRTAALAERVDVLNAELASMRQKALPSNRTSAFIGCQACGSKIARAHLGSEWRCPVCGKDLRAPSAVKAIESKVARIDEARNRLRESRIKDGARAPIRWAVIAEVHC